MLGVQRTHQSNLEGSERTYSENRETGLLKRILSIGFVFFGLGQCASAQAQEVVTWIPLARIEPAFSATSVVGPTKRSVYYEQIAQGLAAKSSIIEIEIYHTAIHHSIMFASMLDCEKFMSDELLEVLTKKVDDLLRPSLEKIYIQEIVPLIKQAGLSYDELAIIANNPSGNTPAHEKLNHYLESQLDAQEITTCLNTEIAFLVNFDFLDTLGKAAFTTYEKNRQKDVVASAVTHPLKNEI